MTWCVSPDTQVVTDSRTIPTSGGGNVNFTVSAPSGKRAVAAGFKFIKTTSFDPDYQRIVESYPSGNDWVVTVRKGGDDYDLNTYVTFIAQ